ncbi:hypothetical protein FGG08_004498 [Glutinoglossum americanum]|uniref:Uncharacterized protein n=1 Tax=Glutinoglossum americanum TaxID=1670608 RepID=A0A9P8L2M7_9PEZI|nr:hypothetical protein FGG08_004498 [Glutinoglossum americanum]
MFKLTSHPNDLQKVIFRGECALAAIPHDHPDRAATLGGLSAISALMYEQTRDISDLQKAISRGEEAVAAASHDHPDRAVILSNVAVLLRCMYQRSGNFNDLQHAIGRGEEAVAATPHGHPELADLLDHLADTGVMKFKQTEDLNDLHKAIGRSEESLASTPTDHPDRAIRLSILAAFILMSFKRTGDLDDLQKALSKSAEAVAVTPHDHPNRAGILSCLATAAVEKFKQTGDTGDLQTAISRCGEAVAIIQNNHPFRSAMLSNLSNCLSYQFERAGDLSDLQKAIDVANEVVATMPDGHPDREYQLNNLDVLLSHKLDNLQKAVPGSKEAETAAPEGNRDRELEGTLAGPSVPPLIAPSDLLPLEPLSRRPSLVDSRREAERQSIVDLDNEPNILCATYQVSWEVKSFMADEFPPGQLLGPVVTLTGSIKDAQAATCMDYMKWRWPETGPILLHAIERAIVSNDFTHQATSADLVIEVLENGDKGGLANESTILKARGSRLAVAEVAEGLAWLSAAFRKSPYEKLTRSEAVKRSWREEDGVSLSFDICLSELSLLGREESPCWLPLFTHSVIVAGFPPRPRNYGIGLDIPFEVMAFLSGVESLVSHEGGLILKGLSSIVFPKQRLPDGSIQWHLNVEECNDHQISAWTVEDNCPDWLKVNDPKELEASRHFLGWCKNSKVTLGTREADYGSIGFTAALEKMRTFSWTTLTLGLGGQKGVGPGASFGFAIAKTRIPRRADRAQNIDRMLLIAREEPLIVYDSSAQRAWLVPAISALLHMVHIWARRNEKFLPRGLPPFADASPDGGEAALSLINRESKFELGSEDDAPLTLKGLVKDFWLSLNESRSPRPKRSGKVIYGYELMDIVRGSDLRLKEHTIKNTAGDWPYLTGDDRVVLFCDGLGEAITPDASTSTVCSEWRSVPRRQDYLAATGLCLQYLAEGCKGGKNCERLMAALQWHQPESHRLFEDCDSHGPVECQRLQELIHRPGVLRKVVPPKDFYHTGAAIFGIAGKIIRPPPVVSLTAPSGPRIQERVESVHSSPVSPLSSISSGRCAEDRRLSILNP